MLWLLRKLKKNSEPRKRKKKGLVTILLVVGVIAFQKFAPKDSELRLKIEDLVSSVTDLLPWFSGSFCSGRPSADSSSWNCKCPITISIYCASEANDFWYRWKTPANTGLAEVDPEKQDIDGPSKSPTCHAPTLVRALVEDLRNIE